MKGRNFAAYVFLLLFIGGALLQGQEPARTPVRQARLANTKVSGCFMKIEGVTGASKAEGHKNWIELVSFSPPTLASERASRPGRVTLSKTMDMASPMLHKLNAGGKAIPVVLVECPAEGTTSGKPKTYLRYLLKNVSIPSYHTSGRNMETLSLNYSKIEMEKSSGDMQVKGKKIRQN